MGKDQGVWCKDVESKAGGCEGGEGWRLPAVRQRFDGNIQLSIVIFGSVLCACDTERSPLASRQPALLVNSHWNNS